MGIKERNEKLTKVKKNEIIDAMERALLSKNYDHLTIDDVAKEAEYSKKTIYSYFGSKDEIHSDLIFRKLDLLNERLEQAANSSEKTGIEKIGILSDVWYKFSIEYPEHMMAIITYNSSVHSKNCKIKQRFEKESEKSLLLVVNAIKEGICEGNISEETDVLCTAISLWSNIYGFIMVAYKKATYIELKYGKSMTEAFEYSKEMVLRSLKV